MKAVPIALTCLSMAAVIATACSRGSDGADLHKRALPLVELSESRREDVRVELSAVGNVRASAKVDVKPQVDGVIAGLNFQEGGEVKAGQLLVALDDGKARAALALAKATRDSARARLVLASRKLARQRQLLAEELVSAEEFDSVETVHLAAKAAVEEREASVQLARRKLEDFHLLAPFDGQAGERAVNVGDYVKKGTNLVSITDTRSVEVSFGVPDRYSGQVAKGMRVIVQVPGKPDTIEGEVVFIDPAVDPDTRRLRLKTVVDNNDGLLKDGQFVELSMVIEVRENRVVIPEEAVLPRAGRSWVYVVKDGVARSREITVGIRLPERIEITSGLQAGEQLVIAGQHRLQDGDRVSLRAE